MIKETAIKKLRASWSDNFLIFKITSSVGTFPTMFADLVKF